MSQFCFFNLTGVCFGLKYVITALVCVLSCASFQFRTGYSDAGTAIEEPCDHRVRRQEEYLGGNHVVHA